MTGRGQEKGQPRQEEEEEAAGLGPRRVRARHGGREGGQPRHRQRARREGRAVERKKGWGEGREQLEERGAGDRGRAEPKPLEDKAQAPGRAAPAALAAQGSLQTPPGTSRDLPSFTVPAGRKAFLLPSICFSGVIPSHHEKQDTFHPSTFHLPAWPDKEP